ncbi:S8 family serine peptidase [Bacillus thuringiensis]|uniref:S8 family serine peptidase n=1 Tax=Bacillus thuringiensis TaxID=1428 RepID=UPI001596BA29|nr:S8 family serine peptidase [Bacillus thuringiensis]MED3634645.1 S8 family serine peptidase [Bacillus thuringiensis]
MGVVLDNGCQIDHEDLKGNVNVGGNFTTNPNNYSDINSYGTHVAGTIAVKEKRSRDFRSSFTS